MVVMPGLVDTHWHLWTSLYRSMSSSGADTAYFALNVRNGVRCTPRDLYHGARLGLVDALNTGITTVHDWAHNLRSPEHADQNLQAHREIGLRGRFSYGTAQGQPVDQVTNLDDIARVKRQWFDAGRVRCCTSASPAARRGRRRRACSGRSSRRRRRSASRSATTPTRPARRAPCR